MEREKKQRKNFTLSKKSLDKVETRAETLGISRSSALEIIIRENGKGNDERD